MAASIRCDRTIRRRVVTSLLAALAAANWTTSVQAAERHLHRFERVQLTDVYYSEGANFGDINRDGVHDAVYGPYWFEGPAFKAKREIYPAQPQPRERYADSFFSWIHDFNGDGWNDVLSVGFPGKPGYVYENPGSGGHDRPWPKHEALDWVSNESPQFLNLVGDERPELVCTRDGFFGYATVEPDHPFGPWKFHRISDRVATPQFGHGLGVGDVDGDGRGDVLMKDGWFQQPASTETDSIWKHHAVVFAAPGGADMHAYDVDGDGDQDVITSLAAHDFGLAWFEQFREGDQIQFRRRMIVGDRAQHNKYGVLFSEPHAVALADIDGDGLKDIVTGKTYWSHHKQSPLWDAGAVVYWFRLVRGPDGVDWVPYLADPDCGIGRQLSVGDVNQDNLPDLVMGGMKGAHVLLQQREPVDEQRWQEAQPRPIAGYQPEVIEVKAPMARRGPYRAPGGQEGESLEVARMSHGRIFPQAMSGFTGDQWSGGQQLFWYAGQPGAKLELVVTADADGVYDLELVLTKAPDYGIAQIWLDGVKLGEPVDLFHASGVVTTGVLRHKALPLKAGKRVLAIEMLGANSAAKKSYIAGLDYVRLAPAATADP